jgi:hypothetical protein
MERFDYFSLFNKSSHPTNNYNQLGENCSTAEVEAVVSNVCGLKDGKIYKNCIC